MSKSNRVGLIGTFAIHAVLIGAGFWSAHRIAEPTPLVYAIELVAAPAPVEAAARPAETTTPPKSDEDVPTIKPKKEPVKTPPKKEPVKPIVPPPPAPVTQAPVKPNPGETPKTGTEQINVSIPGFKDLNQPYMENIVRQVGSRFGDNRPRVTATLSFVILKDGSVLENSIKFIRKSGIASYDTDASSAIELAGSVKAFTSLPQGLDQLEVTFIFKPKVP